MYATAATTRLSWACSRIASNTCDRSRKCTPYDPPGVPACSISLPTGYTYPGHQSEGLLNKRVRRGSYGVHFLERSQVLDAIREHAQDKRVVAAVAYTGHGAAGLVPLKAGDVVVVDGSRNALTSGDVCPGSARPRYGGDLVCTFTRHYMRRCSSSDAPPLSARLTFGPAANDRGSDPDDRSDDRGRGPRLCSPVGEGLHTVDEAWLEWAESVRRAPTTWCHGVPDPPFRPNGRYDIWIGPEDAVTWTEDQLVLAAKGRRLHHVREDGMASRSRSPRNAMIVRDSSRRTWWC